LADDIEHGFHSRGMQEELVEQILKLDPNASIIWGSIERFKKQLEELEEKSELNDWDVTLLDGLEDEL
jgi:MFS superfamily sulfate permease-like transporter